VCFPLGLLRHAYAKALKVLVLSIGLALERAETRATRDT
jgi:hypothetical protein